MSHLRFNRRPALAGACALAGFVGAPLASQAQATTILSDNLSNTSYDVEAATGGTWLASSFGTGASAYTLNSITLLLEQTGVGAATVSVYSDGGLQPGSLVGTLSSPAVYSTTSLAGTTFTASGIPLAANSTFWTVLHAASGSFSWSFTADNTGAGAGFQDSFDDSADAGATWFAYETDPTQMRVAATAVAAPEPSPAAALALGAGLIGAAFLRRRITQGRVTQA